MRARRAVAAGLVLTLGVVVFVGAALAASNSYRSGPVTATFSISTTRPNCKQFDPVTVTVRYNGRPTRASAYYQFFYSGQLVNTQQVFNGTWRNPHNRLYYFYSSFYDSTFGPFGALSVGRRLFVRAVVQVGRYKAYPGLYVTPVNARGCPAK